MVDFHFASFPIGRVTLFSKVLAFLWIRVFWMGSSYHRPYLSNYKIYLKVFICKTINLIYLNATRSNTFRLICWFLKHPRTFQVCICSELLHKQSEMAVILCHTWIVCCGFIEALMKVIINMFNMISFSPEQLYQTAFLTFIYSNYISL